MRKLRSPHSAEVLTTGEVARLCHVAPRTVSKWFDSGRLPGYRIPGSRDRRIPRQELLAFMRTHGMPLGGLEGGNCRVLIIDRKAPREILESASASGRYELRYAANGFEAGIIAHEFRPHVIVVEADTPDETAAVCCNIKSMPQLQATRVIAAVSDCSPATAEALIGQGIDGVIPRPYSLQQLVGAVESTTDLIT